MVIDRQKVDISAPNLMSICIDKDQNHEKQGRFYHRYSAEPVVFTDLNDLLIQRHQRPDGRVGKL